MSEVLFHIFTLVTKTEQYDVMRGSLASVGFDETNTVFTVLDNRNGNVHEPYSGITEAIRASQAPYVVFCHQDLVFYHGPDKLLEALDAVERIDPSWAVAGNAGCTPDLEPVFCVDDHLGSHDLGIRPARVLSLDENFLVIKRDSGLACSPELFGFHLYGTDICLNAYRNGRSAYVIEYRLKHASTTLDFAGLHRMARRFRDVWKGQITSGVIATSCTVLVFSRIPLAFKYFNSQDVFKRVTEKRHLLQALNYLLRHRRPSWLPRPPFREQDWSGPKLSFAVRTADRLFGRERPDRS